MENMGYIWMETFMRINQAINNFVWGPVMLVMLVGAGLYMSIRTGFLQFRKFNFVLKNTIGSLGGKATTKDGTNISPFQAVSTALASTIGVGNVVGVATAITLGGPGAIFWMWVSASFGMMTKYAEILLALKYREKNEWGQYVGGPMYYLKNGLKVAPLAYFFAIFAALATFGTGCMTQANSISDSMNTSFGVDVRITGVVLAIITGIVIVGGIQNIAKVTEKLVPFMAVFFLLIATLLLILRASEIPGAFALIFQYAFGIKQATGGVAGYTFLMAMRSGIARGVFSNEAGLGSAPIAHAASSTKEPVAQALWGVFEVFVTIIVCTMTALIVLTTGVWDSGADGASLTIAAFNSVFPGTIGGMGLTIALSMFALSTLLGWSYYGEKNIEFLFRNNLKLKNIAVGVYRAIYVLCAFLGSVGGLRVIWEISDTMNGLMALPNLIAVLGLSGVVFKETKSYFNSSKHGELVK